MTATIKAIMIVIAPNVYSHFERNLMMFSYPFCTMRLITSLHRGILSSPKRSSRNLESVSASLRT